MLFYFVRRPNGPSNKQIVVGFSWLNEGILGGIRQIFGLVVGNILDSQELKHLKQSLAVVAEGHRPVVGIALLNQHMTVEPAHLRDGKHADAAEGAGLHRQHLPLGDVGPELTLAVAL